MSGEVIVWSKPSCVQCDAVKRALDKRGITYKQLDLSQDEGALQVFVELGFKSAPVVTVDGEAKFAGYDPSAIDELFGKSPR